MNFTVALCAVCPLSATKVTIQIWLGQVLLGGEMAGDWGLGLHLAHWKWEWEEPQWWVPHGRDGAWMGCRDRVTWRKGSVRDRCKETNRVVLAVSGRKSRCDVHKQGHWGNSCLLHTGQDWTLSRANEGKKKKEEKPAPKVSIFILTFMNVCFGFC